uniref:Starch-binding domain-containing protein 1 n=1 Tax=Myripristis murdjan TaxID=586833 RepID=A0A667YH50_9TELE
MNIHDPVLPSCDSEIQWEKSNSGTLRALAEDGNAPVCDPCLQSLHQDQENDHVVNKKAFDKADISANPDMVACDGENIIAPVVAEEMSGPPLSSVYQDQENDHVVNNEADEKASIPAGTDAAACDVENITAHVMAEEMPAPPMPSFYQGQQNDHIGNNETLEEAKVAGGPIVAACNVENSTAPVLTEEMPDPPLLSCCQDQENDHVVNHEAFERASISAGTDAVACDAENISVPVMAEEIPSPHLTCYQETAAASVETTTTDITPSTDAKESSALSLIDENIENNKKVVAVQPMPQNVNVTFCVHYLTHSPSQKVAVTGNQQELGSWKEFIPLERAKDGYWASVISLPAESHVEWKFVLLDEGEVCRWEECDNRLLDTGYGDDLHVHKWWGFL